MFLNSQIILVSSAARSKDAAQTGLPLLRFGLGLDAGGMLIRTLAQNRRAGDILCLSDFGVSAPVPADITRQLLEEARDSGGIFADIERTSPHLDGFLQALDTACSKAGIPLFVPYSRCACAPNAWAVAPGAASGGCLRDELEHGMRVHNGRLAVSFQPTRRRFLLPAADPFGEALTEEALQAAQIRTGAHTFFSRELCVNYFTYMDGDTGVFVLYDTEETLQMRLQLIRDVGVPYIFVEWDGCESLFRRS